MGFFNELFESEGDRAQREHNEGQEAGSQADSITALINDFASFANTDAYNEGFQNGLKNQSDK